MVVAPGYTARIDTFRLANSGTYTILAMDDDGQQTGSYSLSLIGIPVPMPSQVTLVTPANGTTIGADSVLLTWGAVQPFVSNYLLEVSIDSLFGTFVIADSSLLDTTKLVRGLTNNHEYWWRVKAKNSAGWGNQYSMAWEFRVSFTSVGEPSGVPTQYSLSQNYPNPFNPSTTIKYGLPRRAHVALEVYNALGQRVAVLLDETQEAGYHNVAFQNPGLASGVYLYRLQVDGFVSTKKLLLLR